MSGRRSILASALSNYGPSMLLVGMLIFAAGIVLGVVQSIDSEHHLPPVYLNYQKDTYETVIEKKDYARGIPEMRLAAKLDFYGHRPRHFFELARAAYRVGDAEDLIFAREGLQRMVDEGFVDQRGRVFYYLSVVLTLQPDVDRKTRLRSVELAEMALSHDPNHAAGHSHLGLNWVNLGDDRKALTCFSRALELDPDLPQARQGMQFLSSTRPSP